MENYKENENHPKSKNIPLDLEIPIICYFKAISKILTHKHIHQNQFLGHPNSHFILNFRRIGKSKVQGIVLCHCKIDHNIFLTITSELIKAYFLKYLPET